MKTFEQQLREWIELEAKKEYRALYMGGFDNNDDFRKKFIGGAELLLPMVVEMFEALEKMYDDNDDYNALVAIKSIQKKIEVKK